MGGAVRAAVLAAGSFLVVAVPAAAHTVGGPCLAAAEHCERWSVTVEGPPPPARSRPDEFPAALAVSGTTVFAAVKAVDLNVDDPYSSTASWTLGAYDVATGAERWRAFRRSRVYDSLLDVAVSPDGRTLVATGGAYDGFAVGATDSRIVTVAYDAATGAELWSATWDGLPDGTDNGKVVAFAPDGRSVYVGGITTAAGRDLDYVTLAYDAARGRQRWARVYRGLDGGGSDALYDLAVAPDGDRVFVTGESAGAREFDLDYATVAYSGRNGHEVWASRQDWGGADRAGFLAVDGVHVYVSGNSYVGPGGGDYDARTVALRPGDGTVAWEARLGASGFDATRAIVAGAGRIVVTTQSPGASSEGGFDALTAAYDAAGGRELWRTRLAESERSELANDLALAPDARRVYLLARSRPTVPFTALDEQLLVALEFADGAAAWSTRLDAGAGNALTGDRVAVAPDGLTVLTLGQVTRSADPLGPPDQDVYDSLLVALPS